MSLEQALADNTAAVIKLIATLSTAFVPADQSGSDKPKREADAAEYAVFKRDYEKKFKTPAATAPAPAPAEYVPAVCEGDAPGTRYFVIEKHNTVAKVAPGEAVPTIDGAREADAAEYTVFKRDYEKKFKTPAATAPAPAPAAPAPVATPATAATEPSATAPAATASAEPAFEQVVNKMRELHKAQQNAGVMAVLNKFGAAGVPALNGKAPNSELIAAIDSQLLGL